MVNSQELDIAELDHRVSIIASLLLSEDPNHAIEGARQLRMLSIQNRDNEDVRFRLGSCYALRMGILSMLSSNSDVARYWSCHCIVALSHKHKRNQSIINHPGIIHAFVNVLSCGTTPSKGAACSALVESTFRNAENAFLVATTPGLLEGVVAVMQSNQGDVRDDAAGVLRNCSNYSCEAAEVIVKTPGVLCALIEMCKGEIASTSMAWQNIADRFTAMGTIQNLSRCQPVVPILRQTSIMEEALLPALEAEGEGGYAEVMRAESLMAVTNLTADAKLPLLTPHPSILAILTQMLLCAVRGQPWREVAWYDAHECLTPLVRLADAAQNRSVLVRLGLVAILAEVLAASLTTPAAPRLPPNSPLPASARAHRESAAPPALAVEVAVAGRPGGGGEGGDMWVWLESGGAAGEGWRRAAGDVGLAVEALASLARDPYGRRRMIQAGIPEGP